MPKKREPDYGNYGSYQLTDAQVAQAVSAFKWDLLQDMDDERAGALLALLRSFTYTDDNQRRESMLLAAENTLAPFTRACEAVLTKLANESHQQLIQEGGTQ